MSFEPRGEYRKDGHGEYHELANRIEKQRIPEAIGMLDNLEELRGRGIEISDEGKETLASLRDQIDAYLGK